MEIIHSTIADTIEVCAVLLEKMAEAGADAPAIANAMRELKPACGTCQGVGRDARDEGGRCQDCGGNGTAPGLPGIHPKAAALRARVERTMELRKQRFGHHPAGCDGMRSGVCTCKNPPAPILIGIDPAAPGADRTVARLCSDCPPEGYPTDETRCLPCPRRPKHSVACHSRIGRACTCGGKP